MRLDTGLGPRPHGNPAAIASYLGSGTAFDNALAAFAAAYADQKVTDFDEFTQILRDAGRAGRR